MKHFVCLDVDDSATVLGVGQACPKHPLGHAKDRLPGVVKQMDLLAWTYHCTEGCLREPMPKRIAMVHVDIEYLSAPKETNADAGQPG